MQSHFFVDMALKCNRLFSALRERVRHGKTETEPRNRSKLSSMLGGIELRGLQVIYCCILRFLTRVNY